jgi:hypothetical protein
MALTFLARLSGMIGVKAQSPDKKMFKYQWDNERGLVKVESKPPAKPAESEPPAEPAEPAKPRGARHPPLAPAPPTVPPAPEKQSKIDRFFFAFSKGILGTGLWLGLYAIVGTVGILSLLAALFLGFTTGIKISIFTLFLLGAAVLTCDLALDAARDRHATVLSPVLGPWHCIDIVIFLVPFVIVVIPLILMVESGHIVLTIVVVLLLFAVALGRGCME